MCSIQSHFTHGTNLAHIILAADVTFGVIDGIGFHGYKTQHCSIEVVNEECHWSLNLATIKPSRSSKKQNNSSGT